MSDSVTDIKPKSSTNVLPTSLGKTAIIAGGVPIAVQELLVDTFGEKGVWPHEWFTTHYAANCMIVGVAIVGWIMHSNQRHKEKDNA